MRSYGIRDAIAADPNIDFVVGMMRADVYYDGINPTVQAGEFMSMKWSLAENIKRISELLPLANLLASRPDLHL